MAQQTRDPRYDVLFEPVRIGPLTAKNRFYQVPHCTGMGFALPQTLTRMREIKAEGGWSVVCTEYCSIHPSSDDLPFPYCTLWDDDDVRVLAQTCEAVHRHDALVGVQLWYGGYSSSNRLTRENPLAPGSMPTWSGVSRQTRAMDKQDIRDLRRWHRDAALRARRAGFDIVYVYAAHGYLLQQFLSPVQNRRSDEYGGSLENRARLIRELLEETKEAVGDNCAVAIRFAVDNLDADWGVSYDGEGREVVEMLAELPDLWDVNVAQFDADARSARFAEEGAQEKYVSFVKQVTTKPVVGVGRFTTPEAMLHQINGGILDFIGAARPSIADPFLPRKIEEGRIDDIRECIGCNVCIMGDALGVPIRCTQNPTMGEEWRRGWHPERIAIRSSEERVLVVGAGAAGLEAARALGQRGYPVALAEATSELGGRVSCESRLPGLAVWSRVRDYRMAQIARMGNVEVYRDNRLTERDILEFGFDHICIATGARWRRDGRGRASFAAIEGWEGAQVFTPDDVMAGAAVAGPVVVYDDDHFYMGGVIAEKLRADGCEVILVTSEGSVSSQTSVTLEQARIQTRVLDLGIAVVTARLVTGFDGRQVRLACTYTGRESSLEAASLVLVTSREPEAELYLSLCEQTERLADAGIKTLRRIGDCDAPNIIAAAVHAGHRYARELGEPPAPVARDRVVLGS